MTLWQLKSQKIIPVSILLSSRDIVETADDSSRPARTGHICLRHWSSIKSLDAWTSKHVNFPSTSARGKIYIGSDGTRSVTQRALVVALFNVFVDFYWNEEREYNKPLEGTVQSNALLLQRLQLHLLTETYQLLISNQDDNWLRLRQLWKIIWFDHFIFFGHELTEILNMSNLTWKSAESFHRILQTFYQTKAVFIPSLPWKSIIR